MKTVETHVTGTVCIDHKAGEPLPTVTTTWDRDRDWLGEAERIATGSMLPPQHQHVTALYESRALLARALAELNRQLDLKDRELFRLTNGRTA